MRHLLATVVVLSLTTGLHAEEKGAAPAKVSDSFRTVAEEYITLTRSEEAFLIGLKAGLDAGLNPENNIGLKAIPAEKLERIRKEIGELVEKEFTFDLFKDDLIGLLAQNYSEEELREVNQQLSTPVMQKYIKTNVKLVPGTIAASSKNMRTLQPKILEITMRIMRENQP